MNKPKQLRFRSYKITIFYSHVSVGSLKRRQQWREKFDWGWFRWGDVGQKRKSSPVDGGRVAAVVAQWEGEAVVRLWEGRRWVRIVERVCFFFSIKELFSLNLLITGIDFIFSTCHTSMTWNGVNRGNINGAKIDSGQDPLHLVKLMEFAIWREINTKNRWWVLPPSGSHNH